MMAAFQGRANHRISISLLSENLIITQVTFSSDAWRTKNAARINKQQLWFLQLTSDLKFEHNINSTLATTIHFQLETKKTYFRDANKNGQTLTEEWFTTSWRNKFQRNEFCEFCWGSKEISDLDRQGFGGHLSKAWCQIINTIEK